MTGSSLKRFISTPGASWMPILTAFACAGAVDAQRNRGVRIQPRLGDRLTAFDTFTEFPVVDARQGRLERCDLATPPGVGGLRHGLSLHGIHARQSALP